MPLTREMMGMRFSSNLGWEEQVVVGHPGQLGGERWGVVTLWHSTRVGTSSKHTTGTPGQELGIMINPLLGT